MSATRDAVVSDFIVKSCRTDPRPNMAKVVAWRVSSEAQNFILMPSGSVSELYIEPMTACIGDVDIMRYSNNELVVRSIHEVPRHLPNTFKDEVRVFEIVKISSLTNYVLLRTIGELRKQQHENDVYFFVPEERFDTYFSDYEIKQKYLSELKGQITNTHGPAATTERVGTFSNKFFAMDRVFTLPYLSWAEQAADWPTRRRKSDWPDAETIQRIVRNGCDLVQVAHHRYKDDVFQATHQWRISFSRAETVLLNSWTPNQQIVYHILRVVVKHGDLTELRDSGDQRMLSRYHVKTLLMWICEQKHSNWWTRSNIVQISRYVMELLLRCYELKQCRGYFVAASNLIEGNVTPELVNRLKLFADLNELTEWIIKNYIPQCILMCPDNIRRLYNDINKPTIRQFVAANEALSNWRISMTDEDSFRNMQFAILQLHVRYLDFYPRGAVKLYHNLEVIDSRLKRLFVSLVHLKFLSTRAEYETEKGMNILTGTFLKSDQFINTTPLETAAYLLRKSARTRDSKTRSILLILSHCYMSKSNTKFTKCGAILSIYLAVWYYITGQYQTVVLYCRKTLSQSISPSAAADRLLPKTDNIDRVLGLVALYQFLRSRVCGHSRTPNQHSASFDVELFANKVINYLRASLCTKHAARKVRNLRKFQLDVLLKAMINRVTPGNSEEAIPLEFTPGELRRLLLPHSVEQMTLFQKTIARDYRSVCTVVTTDVQAMYSYKTGQYHQCLQLCQDNVDILLNEKRFLSVPLIGPITNLIDDQLFNNDKPFVFAASHWSTYVIAIFLSKEQAETSAIGQVTDQ